MAIEGSRIVLIIRRHGSKIDVTPDLFFKNDKTGEKLALSPELSLETQADLGRLTAHSINKILPRLLDGLDLDKNKLPLTIELEGLNFDQLQKTDFYKVFLQMLDTPFEEVISVLLEISALGLKEI
jgi:hypothetical protein